MMNSGLVCVFFGKRLNILPYDVDAASLGSQGDIDLHFTCKKRQTSINALSMYVTR